MAGSVVIWATKVEERAGRREAALELAGNVAEQLRAAPYAVVRTGEIDLSGELLPAALEEPALRLEVGEDERIGFKRVRIIVSWQGEEPGQLVMMTGLGRGELYR